MLVPIFGLFSLLVVNSHALKPNTVESTNDPESPSATLETSGILEERFGKQSGMIETFTRSKFGEHLGQVTIGDQKFMLDFDTGSSTTWVWSKHFQAPSGQSPQLYQETGKRTKKYFQMRYGDSPLKASVKGNVWLDKVVVAGITATSQPVAVATSASTGLADGFRDGILGLGPKPDSGCQPSRCPSFISRILSSLRQPLFTVMARSNGNATYTFGHIDSNQYRGELAYASVPKRSPHWTCRFSGYSVGSNPSTNHSFQVIVDTGTPFISLPARIVDAYFAKVRGSRISRLNATYFFPCSSKLPSLNLFVGVHKLDIPGSHMSYTTLEKGTCAAHLLISELRLSKDHILGRAFLTSKFVVFDYTGPRVGFAQQKLIVPE